MSSSATSSTVRVATWNAEARATAGAISLMLGLRAHVLLLTEVHPALSLPGYCMTDLIEPTMRSGGQQYAAAAAREGLEMEGCRHRRSRPPPPA